MTTRFVAVAIIALALGGSVGAMAVYAKYTGYIGDLENQVLEAQKAQKELQAKADELNKQMSLAEAKRKQLEAQMASLPKAAAPAEEAAAPAPEQDFEAVGDPGGENRLADILAGQAALMELDRRRTREEERDQERSAQREEWRGRMQEGMTEYFNNALEATTDPTAQQYIMNIQDHINASMDLMRQWREVETEEERDALREQGRQAWETTRNMVREYQDHMLSSSLAQSGITDPAAQQQVLTNLRATMDSEYYNLSGGGFRGGPGGWGGRGGGFRGGPPAGGGSGGGGTPGSFGGR